MLSIVRRILLFLSVLTVSEEALFAFPLLGRFHITANKAVTAMLLVFAIMSLPFDGYRPPRSSKNGWILAFAVACFIGYLHSLMLGFPLSAMAIGASTVAAGFLYYFLLTQCVRDRRDVNLVLWGYVLGVALVSLSAVAGFGEYREAGRQLEVVRAAGYAGSYNQLGYNASIALPLGFMLYLESGRSLVRRALLLGAMGITLVGLLGTASRSAFVAVAVIGAFWMYRFRRFDLLKYAIPVVLLTAATAYIIPDSAIRRLAKTQGEAELAAEGVDSSKRVVGYFWGVKAFMSNPVVGVGRHYFGTWLNENHPFMLSRGQTPHNAIIQTAAELGLVGLVPLVVMLALPWRDFAWIRSAATRRRQLRDPDLAGLLTLATFLQLAYLGPLMGNLFHPYVFEKVNWVLYAMATVLVHLTRRRIAALEASRPLDLEGAGQQPVYLGSPGSRTTLPA